LSKKFLLRRFNVEMKLFFGAGWRGDGQFQSENLPGRGRLRTRVFARKHPHVLADHRVAGGGGVLAFTAAFVGERILTLVMAAKKNFA
jgi:hypothetical protein